MLGLHPSSVSFWLHDLGEDMFLSKPVSFLFEEICFGDGLPVAQTPVLCISHLRVFTALLCPAISFDPCVTLLYFFFFWSVLALYMCVCMFVCVYLYIYI